MEDYLQSLLHTRTIKRFGTSRVGGTSSGYGYETDTGRVFVKSNLKPEAEVMFDGEYHGLKEISKTKTVNVPEPLATGKCMNEHLIVMEYFDIKPLKRYSEELGTALAELHLKNINLLKSNNNFVGRYTDEKVEQFGFHVKTSCGAIEQENEWCKDWVPFYVNQRLLPQVRNIQIKSSCREVSRLWSQLVCKIPRFFNTIEVKPSLLHGDLWSGNAGETDEKSIVFDPASFYGHHEYDLAIAKMFGGFGREFFESYHKLIPKAPGFDTRMYLYQLFHHLNHWNQFGTSYRISTLATLKKLVDAKT